MRVIGKRQTPIEGVLREPTQEERERVRQLNDFPSRVPKGVFRYKNHLDAERQWDLWMADTMVANEERHGRI